MNNKTPIICLFGGAFKPPTRAHFEVVQKAAKICNEVKVIISNQDRGGYNSFISEKVWKQYKKLLPENVTIKVAENNSPVTDIYKEVKNKDNNYLVIFGKGEQDRYNSINEQREKYSNVEVLDIGNIEDISATRLREAITKRDLKEIQKLIPEGIKVKDFLLNFQLHEEKIPGGLAKGKSLQDIAKHHKEKLSTILLQLAKGIEVEMEHTTSKKIAKEIAMDHLWEDPKYYDKLASIEEIKINHPLTKSWEEVRDLSRYLMSKTDDKLQMRNHIDDILEKYGDVYMYLTTTKFLQEVSPNDLYSIYKELLQLKDKFNIKEIKINKPISFPINKDWIYIIKDEDDYNKVSSILDKSGWVNKSKYDYKSYLIGIGTEYIVIFKYPTDNKEYILSTTRLGNSINRNRILNKERLKPIEENIEESKNLNNLYHFTTIEYAANILKTNNLRASYVPKKEHERDFQSFGRERGERLKQQEGEGAYYISLTRDKQLYKKSPKIAGSSIRFTVDGTKLSSNYKIVPFFYYKDELMGEKDRHRYNENEERIISNVDKNGLKDFKKYLIKTELILDVLEDIWTYINRAKQLKEFYPDLITLYKEKPMSIEQYEQEIVPNIEPYRDEEFLEIVDKTLNEVFTPENHQSILDRAIEWGCNYLQIEKPQINFINDPNYVQQHSSFGGYQPSDKSIIVSVYNRNTADICRSTFHEILHFKQDIEGRLNLEAGKDGDPYENEANAIAGKMLRKLGREMPEIFEI